MKDKKLIYGILGIIMLAIVGIGLLILFKPSISTPAGPFSIEFCDSIKLEAVKTQFCLDNRLIKDYEAEYFDWRDRKIKDQMKAGINIKTRDYKESGKIIIGSSAWRDFKVVSGIKLSFIADFNPRIKNFDDLKKMYLRTFYEPHDEFPPQKGWKVGSIDSLNYVYSLKVNDPESYSKGLEVETHFLNNGMEYELTIWASQRSISEESFRLLYNTILRTIEFGTVNHP